MGGILISELLEAKKSVAHNLDKLILQPMQAQDELRKYLLIISLLYYPTYQDKTFLAISHSENREFVSH